MRKSERVTLETLRGGEREINFLKNENAAKYVIRKIPAGGFCSEHKNSLSEIVFLLAVNSLCLWIIYFLGHSLGFNIPCCVLLRCQIEVQN